MELDAASSAFREFVAVVKALRTPGTGCPWDLEQDHRTLRPYLVEETYEVLDAIDHGDDSSFQEELGDLLLQIVLHAQVAADRGAFAIGDVVRSITEKMVRRHPHVFGSVQVSGSDEVSRNWEQIKAAERQAGKQTPPSMPFDRIPKGLPALLRAQKLIGAAAKVGGASRSVAGDCDDLRRQLASLIDAVSNAAADPPQAVTAVETTPRTPPALEHSLGRLLFGLCQLARQLGVDAEESLQSCNRRFVEGNGCLGA